MNVQHATRFAFGVFAGTLFALTHWPRLAIHVNIERPDLIIHVTAFAMWVGLGIAAAPFGRALSLRNINKVALAGVCYAPLDELSQGLPGLGRTVGLDDLAANCAGILIGWSICLVLRKVRRVSE
jgi:VanZ family protein